MKLLSCRGSNLLCGRFFVATKRKHAAKWGHCKTIEKRRRKLSKMATPKFDRDKAAKVLIDAVMHGDETACEKWSITRQSLHRYKQRLSDDTEFLAILDSKRKERQKAEEEKAASRLASLRVRQKTLSELAYDEFRSRLRHAMPAYSEKDLQNAIAHKASEVSRAIGLPEVVSVESSVRVNNTGLMRADLLFHHRKGFITIVEVKSHQKYSSGGWLLYPAIGQILYYKECVCDQFEVDRSKVGMAILSDYEPDMYFMAALNQVKERIHYLNVLPILKGDLNADS